MNWITERLSEKSTWLGLFGIGSAFFGFDLEPEQQNAVIFMAIALLGGGHVVSKG